MLSAIVAAIAQMELETKRERIVEPVSQRREAGNDLGGRRQSISDSQIRNIFVWSTAVSRPRRDT